MAKELYNNILQRLPSALLLASIIFGILYLQNNLIIFILTFIVGLLLTKEWLSLSETKINLKQIIFFVAPVALSFYFLEKFIALYLFTATLLWFGYSALLISKKSSFINSISFKNNYLGIFLMLSFLFSLIYLMLFLEFPGMNKFFVLFLVLFNTALVDVAAYLVGSSIGKTPLFPEISPNKTLEGFLGGLFAVLIFMISMYSIDLISLELLVISMLSIPFTFPGDYFESQLKREQNVKDSGSLIPGHGGIWDRLDSHIAVVPIFVSFSILAI